MGGPLRVRPFLSSLALLAAAPAAVPGEEVRDLGPLLTKVVADHGVPGMAAAIVQARGAEIVQNRRAPAAVTALGAAGVRARGSDAKVLPTDRFHLGSCTKAMTATLCAMLVEEGKLAWDTPVAKALEDPSKADPGWKGATLEHLLTMRAGAPPDLGEDGLWARLWAREGTPTEQRAALALGVLGKPPMHPPGKESGYANASYALAGHLAEKAAGKPYEDLLRERIFAPLEMDSAGFGAPGSADALDAPRGHDSLGRAVPPGPLADNPPAIAPAGTVHATIGDWAKFVALHVDGALTRWRLLEGKTFRRLQTAPGDPNADGYAMGWQVTRRPWGGRVLTHAGSNTMWTCVAWIAPEKGFAVLAACNEGGDKGAGACDAAAAAMIRNLQAPR